jgi:hypothetical protein
MKYLKALFGIGIGLMIFGIAYAAPTSRFDRTIIPETTNTYDLGSSTSSWRSIYTNIGSGDCLQAGTGGVIESAGAACGSGGGGGGAGGGWSTSTPNIISTNWLSATNALVGINSSTPWAVLTVKGISGTTTPTFVVASSSNAILLQVAPNGLVTVENDLTVNGALTLGSALSVSNGGTGVTGFTAGEVLFGNGSTDITSSGSFFWDDGNARLGVGTSTPDQLLTVAKDQDAATTIRVVNNGSGALSSAAFDMTSLNSQGFFLAAPTTHTLTEVQGRVNFFSGTAGLGMIETGGMSFFGAGAAADIRFYTGGFTSSERRMTITSTGRVGIGTTTPAQTLNVVGSGIVDPFSVSSSTGISILKVEADGDVIIREPTFGNFKVKPMVPAIIIASTTLDTLGKTLSTGTTTWVRYYPFPVTLVQMGCETVSAGTALMRVGDGTNFVTPRSCSTTPASSTPVANNTWTAEEKIQIEVGSGASSPNGVNAYFMFMPTP